MSIHYSCLFLAPCIAAYPTGAALGGNGENRTVPNCRLPRGPSRDTFEKNNPMVTIHHRRVAPDESDVIILKVLRGDNRTLARMVGEKFEPGPTVITDEHQACKSLGRLDTSTRPSTTKANTHQENTTRFTPTTASAR